jgi:protoheme ferro-lyase
MARCSSRRVRSKLGARLESRFGRVQLGWLNHVYGGKWTEPAADVALRDLEREGFRRVAYYPFGFLADNAESQLEGRVALRSAPGLAAAHLPCLNADPDLITVMRDQLIAAVEATRVPAAVSGTADRTTARTA